MKIVFSTYETKEIGGSYLRSLSIAKGLAELGHEITLWTSAKKVSILPKFSTDSGVKIIESIGIFPYRFRKGGYDPFDLVFRSLSILFSECEIIHSFNHRPASTIPALLKTTFCKKTKWFLDWADLWGKGGIADRRNGLFSFFTKNIDHYTERFFIKAAHSVTPISDDLLKKAKSIRGSSDNIFFLGVGANIKEVKPISISSARKKLNFSNLGFILAYLYVGTYDDELLARIFVEICNLRSDVKLLMLGPSLNAFEKYIGNFPVVSKKVIRAGVVNREELSCYLSSANLMLLPFANKEINLGKFPNKLGDYLAAGRPIAANPTGEVKKILLKEKIGFLFPEDPKKFALGIIDVLSDKKTLVSFGKNSRFLAEKMSWLSISKQLECFYVKNIFSKTPG